MTIFVDDLLEGIKTRGLIVSSRITLTDPQILTQADRIMQLKIVPLIESTQTDFFVIMEEEDIVAGQNEYPIPYRAVGRALRDLKMGYINANDETFNIFNVVLVKLEEENLWQWNGFNNNRFGFYFLGDKIRILPNIPTVFPTSLRLQKWYRLAPSRLVESSDAALVTSVSAPNVVVSSVPDTLSVGSVVDFIQGISGSSIISMDKTITNISGTTITFGAGVVPDTLVAGDYISIKQTAPVCTMIPNEAQSYIETLTAMRCLKILGDNEGADALKDDEKEEKENLLKLLEPRIDGEPKIIINRNNILRSRVGGYGGTFYYPYPLS